MTFVHELRLNENDVMRMVLFILIHSLLSCVCGAVDAPSLSLTPGIRLMLGVNRSDKAARHYVPSCRPG